MVSDFTKNYLKRLAPLLLLSLTFYKFLRYWAVVVAQCPTFCGRGYDDFAYHADFVGLLNGSWPGDTIFIQSPLPAVFLVVVHWIFQFSPDNLAIPYLIQIFLVILTITFAYKLATVFFSPVTGLLTILILTFYEFVKFYATTIEANTLATFLLTTSLYFFYKFSTKESLLYLTISGVSLGGAILARSNNIAMVGAFFLWLLVQKPPPKHIIAAFLTYIGLTALVLSPAVWHSSRLAGKFVFITKTGLYNLTMGNLPDSPGYYAEIGVSSLEPTLQFIAQQPGAWLLLTLRKTQLFFTFPWSSAGLHELPVVYLVGWSITIILFTLYFIKTFTYRRSILHFSLLFYSLSIIITHIEDEYRVPIFPLLAIFIAALVIDLATLLGNWFLQLYSVCSAHRLQRQFLVGWIIVAVITLFYIFLVPARTISYRVASVQSPPVHSGILVGQKFVVPCPNFSEVAVTLVAPMPGYEIPFILREDDINGREIHQQTLNTTQFSTLKYHSINFPAIPDSAGKTYLFYLDSSNLTSAETGLIFAGGPPPFAQSLNRVYKQDRIKGNVFVSLGDLDGNLAFSARCDATPFDLVRTGFRNLVRATLAFRGVNGQLFGTVGRHPI